MDPAATRRGRTAYRVGRCNYFGCVVARVECCFAGVAARPGPARGWGSTVDAVDFRAALQSKYFPGYGGRVPRRQPGTCCGGPDSYLVDRVGFGTGYRAVCTYDQLHPPAMAGLAHSGVIGSRTHRDGARRRYSAWMQAKDPDN